MRRSRSAAVPVGLALVLAAVSPAGRAGAHEFRAGALRLDALDADRYALALVLPESTGAGPLAPGAVGVALSPGCVRAGAVVDCAGGVALREVRLTGLDAAALEVVVRYTRLDGAVEAAVLDAARPTFRFGAPAPAVSEVLGTFLALGVEHILLGPDHLLFVLGLLLVVRGVRRVVATLTAFTVAHSATLALASLGLVRLAPAPVEAIIALSVLLLAVEAARPPGPSLLRRRPEGVAFVFGLVHGLGFAGALREVGLPDGQALPALAGFNVGVELGQLAVVAVALALARLVKEGAAARRARLGAVYALGAVSAAWALERTAAVLTSVGG